MILLFGFMSVISSASLLVTPTKSIMPDSGTHKAAIPST